MGSASRVDLDFDMLKVRNQKKRTGHLSKDCCWSYMLGRSLGISITANSTVSAEVCEEGI